MQNSGGSKMICLVLAAGYATRLYPLTKNFPKPLLEVKGKPILDWLLDDIDNSAEITQYAVVTNHKFAGHFEKWASEKKLSAPIKVIDDMTESNETRLGAVRDISFANALLKKYDDLLVIAGDNVLDFSLVKFIEYFKARGKSCVMRYFEPDTEKLKKCGVAKIDENEKVVLLEEKPEHPASNWCTPPFYIYKKEDIHFIDEGINAGCGVDAPGSFIAWLCGQTEVYSMEMPGSRYDIGNLESYKKIDETYQGIIK
jgi:glucose-1-phosphate thymidylyltransferase